MRETISRWKQRIAEKPLYEPDRLQLAAFYVVLGVVSGGIALNSPEHDPATGLIIAALSVIAAVYIWPYSVYKADQRWRSNP